jgi:hypothetical protein
MGENLRADESSLVQCYRDAGIFFCADYLRDKGIKSPGRVAVLVGQCLRMSASGEIPLRAAKQTSEAYVATCLDWTFAHQDAVIEGRFDRFAECVNREVQWDAYTEFAELLNVESGPQAYEAARRRFMARGLTASIDLLRDVAVGFVDTALPNAVRSFDLVRGEGREAAWLTAVFLHYAMPRLLAQRSVDLNLETLADLRRPDIVFEETEREELSNHIRDALTSLDESLALPMRMYFGFDNPSRSVRQVARRLGTSEYRTRLRIVRGLAAIAARLNAPGVLDTRELGVAREMFLVGSPVESAAKRLGLRPAQVKASLASLEAKLAVGLAESKTASVNRADEGVVMTVAKGGLGVPVDVQHAVQHQTVPQPDWATIVKEIVRFHGRVERQVGDGSVYRVRVGDMEFNVPEFIVAINTHTELRDLLEASDVDLGWLITPPPSRDRKNRSVDFEEWNAAIEELSSRAWTTAESLYERWTETLKASEIRLLDDRIQSVDRVLGVLSTVVSGLEEQLPRAVRRGGRGILVVKRGERVMCTWEGSSAEMIDVEALARFAVEVAGGFTHERGELLAQTVTDGLATGDLAIPGFRLLEHLSDGVRFEWESQMIRLPATTSA